MKLFEFISTVICIITFTCCNTKDSNSSETALASPVDKKVKGPLVGLWSINIMYGNHMEPDRLKAELILKEDSTFIYLDENIYGQNFSEGTWSNNATSIILKSFEKYKPTPEDTAKEKNPLQYYTYKPRDTIKKNFDNIHFTLKNDTLISVDKRAFFNHLLFVKYDLNKSSFPAFANWMEFQYDQ